MGPQIDVQIGNYHLLDNIEWDLLSPLTPEAFSQKLCTELGLSGEAIPLIAHAIHEELVKHKKDAVEWGVIGGDREVAEEAPSLDKPRDKSGAGLLKDKTGLGLGWGRAPKDGRGPKVLKSVWRDWADVEEFKTRFEVLSAEEVERREIEKERASRSVLSDFRLYRLDLEAALLIIDFPDGCGGRRRNSRAAGLAEDNNIVFLSVVDIPLWQFNDISIFCEVLAPPTAIP